ncbi:MAG: tRNA (adenosine(37)-N6)-threonylcarbamoyltransferase complex ATPase subunit type 1 TsaE [Chitinophagaceae bacterium]
MNITFTLNEINKIALEFWQLNQQKRIWAFHAQMGAGKTTFIRALCEELNLNDVVTSPTFAIINEYKSEIAGTIYHMDWYRIKNEEEAIRAGVEDCLTSGNFCLIEWPENASQLLPEKTLDIYIEIIDENSRRIFAES